MSDTLDHLESAFPKVVAHLIFDYFDAGTCDAFESARMGCYEDIMFDTDDKYMRAALSGATSGDHPALVSAIIGRLLAPALAQACDANNIEMAHLLVSHGASWCPRCGCMPCRLLS